jgi:hypothetical protein
LRFINNFERNAALGDVPFVLLGIETDRHALLYIRIYVNATTHSLEAGRNGLAELAASVTV